MENAGISSTTGQPAGAPQHAWEGRGEGTHGTSDERPPHGGVTLIGDSSPRAWGGRASAQYAPGRLTPTCVGRTASGAPWSLTPSTRPHVRGEDGSGTHQGWKRGDSPPRAWGGRPVRVPDPVGDRLTSTCVGRTLYPAGPVLADLTHPHVRGGGFAPPQEHGAVERLTPRAWGGSCHGRAPRRCLRLTPTCVGRTTSRAGGFASGPTHPHVRGEDSAADRSTAAAGDSPPRAWGGPRRPRRQRPRLGLTPTCVGRTRSRSCPTSPGTTHPHVRGEDTTTLDRSNYRSDSPPRAWGGLCDVCKGGVRWRLTPTCVGRTSSSA